ncbi:hypothetical protein GQ457_13G023110 [Hibiscus cannabinus]
MEVGIPICRCGLKVKVVVSWTDDNPGRRFYGCKNYGREFKASSRSQMHGLSRLGSGSNRSVPSSPSSSPRFRYGRYKSFSGGGGRGEKQWAADRIVFVLISTVFRRKGVLLFAPLLYIAGMLLYMGLLGFDVLNLKNAVVVVHRRSPPGSVYHSPRVFQKLWPSMEAESNASHNALMTTWNLKMQHGWKPCINSIISKTGWSSAAHYLQKVLPKLEAMGAVRIAPFSNRLAYSVPSNVQGIRCLSNFQALRFAEPIRTLADKMVERMVKNSSHSGGKYVSVHLRFEMDMVAFSCCEYDGGEEEKHEMDIARERSWRGKFRRRGRVIRPGANRMDGKCPLTPLEVGLMLRGMGFDNNTSVFVAAGNIYKAEKYMAPLKQMFPLLETKDTLATPEELAPFKGHSSRLAALDYTVCLHSEVFVTTQGGNFPHFLIGHRRYLFGGHAKTIKPDKRKLALLFDSPHIRWETFKRQMKDMLRHSDMKGNELKKPSASVYTFPVPDCMCKQTEAASAANGSRSSFE